MIMNKKLEVIKVIPETHDTKSFRFKLDEPMDFKPGQFMMIGVDVDINGEKKIVKRAYSISTPPSIKDYFETTIKKMENGLVSTRMQSVKEGELLEVSGPYGKFIYDEKIGKNIFLIGAGSGITPLASILRYIVNKKSNVNVKLIFSVKTPKDIIYKDEILNNYKDKKNVKCVVTITRPDGYEWDGEKGRVTSEMIKKYTEDVKKEIFFLCGPPAMVDDISNILKSMQVDPENIKTEKYG